MNKRLLDILLAICCLIILLPIALVIVLCVRLSSDGPAIYWSKRVGKDGVEFLMPKFRTMYVNTREVETELLAHPETQITKFGKILRKTSLDEIPQIISVLQGHMSFVGPRPALFSQTILLRERRRLGIHLLRPGITGWAQINGRDQISISKKIELDNHYLMRKSFWLDLEILFRTVVLVLKSKDIRH